MRDSRRCRSHRARLAIALALAAVAALPAGAAAASKVADAVRAQAAREGSVRVLVQLATDAVPEAALAGAVAVAAQRAEIASAQAALAQELAVAGATPTRLYDTIPYSALAADGETLARLAASPLVRAVVLDRARRPALAVAAPLQGADQAWAAGFDGSGQTVAVLDTGTDRNHPFLAGKVVGEACFSQNGSCPNGQPTQLGDGAAAPCTYASGCDHGTHVAGIAVGRGDELSGIARGATLLPIQVFSRATGSDCPPGESVCPTSFDSDQIAALEYVYEQRATWSIAAVNMSLGGDRYTSQAQCDAASPAVKAMVDNLRAVGIATIVAAGNESFTDALASPGCLSSVVSVGATTREDRVASFSNSATFLTLLATGDPVVSALPGGGFGEQSGTSQATPMVAGAFAVLRQRNPSASIDQIVAALVSTGLPVLDERNGITKPRLQVKAALDALAPAGSPAGVQITPDQRFHLVSKDVGSERWAITFDPQSGFVTGNVFDAGGGEPRFVACSPLSPADGQSASDLRFSCSGAQRCAAAPCAEAEWSFIAEPTLPRAFFDPPAGAAAAAPAGPDAAAAIASAIAPSPPLGSDSAPARQSGLQITPDRSRVLVSKDLAGERWAIGRDVADGAVTGNVFRPAGGDPQFVYCTQVSASPSSGTVRLSCAGAGRCPATPCAPEQWTSLGEVELPVSFFEPPVGP